MPVAVKPKKLELEKELYQEAKNKKMSFSEYLELKDPSGEYGDSGIGKLDAFQRQMMAHGLQVKGKDIATLEDFFRTSSSSILFPEFVSRNVQVGMNMGKLEASVDDIVSTTSQIDSASIKSAEFDLDNSKTEYSRVAEGSEFPTIKIRLKEKTIDLKKIGVRIESSYEALRRTKLNVVAIGFQAIGRNLATKTVKEALETLINGDGNSNPAGSIAASTAGTIAYDDLINLEMAFEIWENEIIIGNKTTVIKLMQMTEFKDPLIAKEFILTGKFISPFGNTLLMNSGLPDGLLLGFNKKAGIEQIVESGSSLVEEDKLISKQLNETVISKVLGFSKIWANSAYYLTF